MNLSTCSHERQWLGVALGYVDSIDTMERPPRLYCVSRLHMMLMLILMTYAHRNYPAQSRCLTTESAECSFDTPYLKPQPLDSNPLALASDTDFRTWPLQNCDGLLTPSTVTTDLWYLGRIPVPGLGCALITPYMYTTWKSHDAADVQRWMYVCTTA